MKKNKKIFITIIALILLIIIVTITVLLFNNKKINNNEVKTSYLTLNAVNQAQIEEEIKNNLEKNKYPLAQAGIYINPYGNSPLSAMITFSTENKESVEVTIKGKNNNDIKLEYNEKNTEHYIPVFGLYEGTENEVIVKLSNGKSKTFNIKMNKIEIDGLKSI